MMMFFKFLFLLPGLIYGQSTATSIPGEFYRRIHEDGREAILMERFSDEVKYYTITLRMTGNSCRDRVEPVSCTMSIPFEARVMRYFWIKHFDPEQIGQVAYRAYRGRTRYIPITPFHHLFWEQLGHHYQGRNTEYISLTCGHFDWVPEDQPREEINIQAMAFQMDRSNEQRLDEKFVPQYILLVGPILSISSEDGSYFFTRMESLGRIDELFSLYIATDQVEVLEFVFKAADLSTCQAVFSVALKSVSPLTSVNSMEGMAPVIVDERDIHQIFQPRKFSDP